MKTKFDRVYQFRMTLNDIRPPVWRRIQVPETYSFWDLHVAIQDVMGWFDSHLHGFEIMDPSSDRMVEIGIPDDDFPGGTEVLPGWERKIALYFSPENPIALYTYDFGDNWEHRIELEKILPRQKGVFYPCCTGGQRACPPEDCGGTGGYEDFLEIIMDPGHDHYESMLMWAGGNFEPEFFSPDDVVFDDPAKRFRTLWD